MVKKSVPTVLGFRGWFREETLGFNLLQYNCFIHYFHFLGAGCPEAPAAMPRLGCSAQVPVPVVYWNFETLSMARLGAHLLGSAASVCSVLAALVLALVAPGATAANSTNTSTQQMASFNASIICHGTCCCICDCMGGMIINRAPVCYPAQHGRLSYAPTLLPRSPLARVGRISREAGTHDVLCLPAADARSVCLVTVSRSCP